jgi:hypothetical protein
MPLLPLRIPEGVAEASRLSKREWYVCMYVSWTRTPANPHWARVVGYGSFSLWVIHKEGLCPSSGDINGLIIKVTEELDGRAVSALSVWTRKLSNDRRGQSLDGWAKFITRAPPCFGRHVKLLVPAAFAVVSIHSSFNVVRRPVVKINTKTYHMMKTCCTDPT